jgi:hypothetical protein
MKPADLRLRLVKSVRTRLGADRGFIFDDRTGRVYTLNTTAAFALGRLQAGLPVADIVDAVTEQFQAEAPAVRRDLERFIEQVVGEGLGRLDPEATGG